MKILFKGDKVRNNGHNNNDLGNKCNEIPFKMKKKYYIKRIFVNLLIIIYIFNHSNLHEIFNFIFIDIYFHVFNNL